MGKTTKKTGNARSRETKKINTHDIETTTRRLKKFFTQMFVTKHHGKKLPYMGILAYSKWPYLGDNFCMNISNLREMKILAL